MIAAPGRSTSPARATAQAAVRNRVDSESCDGPTTSAADDLSAAADSPVTSFAVRKPAPQDDAVDQAAEDFDRIAVIEAETDREINALRDMAMEQIKQDDELLKKWIELI